MSMEDTAPESIKEMIRPLADGKFVFACHPGVPCFTECCRRLKLLLTPYDILRLKKRLGLNAEDFVDDYCDMQLDENRGLPMMYLKMSDTEEGTCPFVSSEGCKIYEDRPAACRIYPLARASRMHRLHGTVQENYFVLQEPHCRGFEEKQEWTPDAWTADQGLELYHELNNLWMEIITDPKMRQGAALSGKAHQMFYMTSYNLDMFRKFVTGSRFFQVFDLTNEEVREAESDDTALLRLAFRWFRFSLLSEPCMKMREAPTPGE